MEKSVNLPLYDEFMDIFENHEVKNWQAKHFWLKMRVSKSSNAARFKRAMYSGIRVLVECKYLEVDLIHSTKKTFSYTETQRLNVLRNNYKKYKLESIFLEKKAELLDQINDKENNIEFLDSLLLGDETLEKYLINHKEKLMIEIKKINSNIKLMDNIMS